MKNKKSNSKYLIMCLIFVVAIIVIGVSLSYAFTVADITGDFTETTIQAGTFDIETSLTNMDALNASNMLLINEDEIETEAETLEFTVASKSTSDNAGKFNVYLKNIKISNNLISNDFKWQLLMDDKIIANGSFGDISTTNTSDSDTNYYDTYYLKKGIDFNGFNTSNLELRIYLLNSSLDQSNLLNGTFECKVAIEAYTTK